MKYLLTILICLYANSLAADVILLITDDGYFVSEVNGEPSDWSNLNVTQVVDTRDSSGDGGNGVPPLNKVSIQVDKWSDTADEASGFLNKHSITRDRLVLAWKQIIDDVENDVIDMVDVERHVSATHAKIFENLPEESKQAWLFWSKQVSGLATDASREGNYNIDFLMSVQKGLAA